MAAPAARAATVLKPFLLRAGDRNGTCRACHGAQNSLLLISEPGVTDRRMRRRMAPRAPSLPSESQASLT
jgi:hypothetical protein